MAHNNGMIPRPPKKGSGKRAAKAGENAAKFQAAVTPVGAEEAIDPAYAATPLAGMSEGSVAAFIPHRPARPEKSEGGKKFKLVSEYEPAGDQPTAIAELVKGIQEQERDQVLLGVTGSG